MIGNNKCVVGEPIKTIFCWFVCVALLGLSASSFSQQWDHAYFRGTPNNWGADELTFNSDTQLWETVQEFSGDNPRFKITRSVSWDESYPEDDFHVEEGRYRILFSDTTYEVSVTEVAQDNTTTNKLVCYDNALQFNTGFVYFWNPTPSGAMVGLNAWPGYPMANNNNHLCYDLSEIVSGGVLPETVNVIFNNNAGSQTQDLVLSGDSCYRNNQWLSLAGCGVGVDEFSISVGEDVTVDWGDVITLEAISGNGDIAAVEWTSEAWSGVLEGNPISSQALLSSGSFTVNATALSNADALASDDFLLTVNPKPDSVNANSVCFANPDDYALPHVYFWGAVPEASMTEAPPWPGEPMEMVGDNYCFDFSDYLVSAFPESINIIFNDGASQQTEDLTYLGNSCYTAQGWSDLAACDLMLGDSVPQANAGADQVVSLGESIELSASASTGEYQQAIWSSALWSEDLTGELTTTPVFSAVGDFSITLTLVTAGGDTVSDTLQVTVLEANGNHGMPNRPVMEQPHAFPVDGNVSQGNYRFEVAYPNLVNQFMAPVMITADPVSGLLFVVDKPGVIYAFPDSESVTPQDVKTVLDISSEVKNYHEQGLLSIAFDPDYASNGYLYGYYIYGESDDEREANGQFGDAILKRWRVADPYNPSGIVSGSGVELLRIAQPGPDHKGGMLQFHPESNYLYLSVGDGAYGHSAITSYPEDPRTNNNAQVTSNLLGSIIRINPLDQPINGKYYDVPSDNPFVGVAGFRPEIWSYGHRNPWRWAFDSEAPYTLWETEVGQAGFEEVNLIERGKNYGWPMCEGTTNRGDLGGDSSKDCSVDFAPPREGYNHPVGRSVIGGFVYRGNSLPGLNGRFVFGDYVTKKIWAVADGEAKQLVTDAFPENIASFGTGVGGESLLVSTYGVEYGGNSTIYRLLDDDAERATIPSRLSETGLFESLQPLVPKTGVMEYKVNTDGWFDGASVRHFMVVAEGETIDFSATDDWELPVGSVLVKHKTLQLSDASQAPFTTSVLFRQRSGKWQAANYYWNEDYTDATLVTETTSVSNTDVDGRDRPVQAAADCGSCHTGNGSREPLAIHTRQLNRNFDYSGVVDNQLDAFNHVDLFSEAIDASDNYDRFVAIDDSDASELKRAKSYLATNCAHCHSSTFMDLRFDTPLADMKLLNVQTNGGQYRLKPFSPADSLLHIYQVTDSNRMPKGTLYTNSKADTFFRDWITAAGAQTTGLQVSVTDTLNPGDSANAIVSALFDNGFSAPVGEVTVAVTSNPGILSVESVSGHELSLRAHSVGTATLTVQAEGFDQTITIKVVELHTAITSLAIAPSEVSLRDTQQLVVYGVAADGTKANVYERASWHVSSGNNAVAVDNQGLLTRINSGPATVTAQVGDLTASVEVTEPSDDVWLRFDNSNNWESVYVYLWVTIDGVDQPLTEWPGVPMNNTDGNWWRYGITPDQLPDGTVNAVFNAGEGGAQTADLNNITESVSYTNGQLQPWDASGINQGIYRVAVIGGTTENNERDFPVGSLVTVTADEAPLGTEFTGWQGDGAAFIVGPVSNKVVQLLIPDQNVSLQALFTGGDDLYQLGRDFYAAQCASCHGDDGSGGVAKAINALDDTWSQPLLANYIADFMPMDNSASCDGTNEGDCALEIARMVIDEAWQPQLCDGAECEGDAIDARNLRLLTKTEYLNSVRDVFNINFSAEIMNTVPADGRYRNFTTASYLSSGYDRTLGYQMVAKELAEQAIARYTFNGLENNCQDMRCAVSGFGKRLFRRPLSGSEVDAYTALYDDEDGGRRALQAMLMSPHFMYRSELGLLNAESGLYELSPFEVVTSLAYIFWASTPDATLLTAASDGDLNLSSLLNYVLNDARAEQGLRRFIGGWLINNQYPFPAISNPDLVVALKEETVRFVLENIESNMPFSELLLAGYTQANDLVAGHYNLEGAGAGWGVRNYNADDPRAGAGLLGHASFLASRTNTVNPSPIKRGVFVREMLMCQEFPPPAAANFDVTFEDDDSNREATARHTSEPACRACHQFIDGVGFGFERYDSQGLYRVIETLGNGQTQEVDASGSIKSLYSPETVMDPDSEAVPYHSIAELAELIAGSGQGEACFARQFYRYVVGREESELSDEIIIRSYSQDLRNGGGMRDMLKALVLSDSFTKRR
ncbi:starch-binding protein [Gilvimarinus agarilyticus]|uniref:starch-binding protein n=1 Tax=Gilvimarinus agarilyticus TaxID=679259 RepID=UPI0005A0EB90|nr:starch-binding protein [Gilvimarinus agarilyticus]